MHFYWSKCMSRSPLCSRLLNFYTPVRPARQKLASSSESMHFFAVKVDVAVATLRPFGEFLYPGPPCASKIGQCDPTTSQVAVNMRSKWMSTSRLCSRLHFFYTLPPFFPSTFGLSAGSGTELHVNMRSKCMSTSPLCGRLADFS